MNRVTKLREMSHNDRVRLALWSLQYRRTIQNIFKITCYSWNSTSLAVSSALFSGHLQSYVFPVLPHPLVPEEFSSGEKGVKESSDLFREVTLDPHSN